MKDEPICANQVITFNDNNSAATIISSWSHTQFFLRWEKKEKHRHFEKTRRDWTLKLLLDQ